MTGGRNIGSLKTFLVYSIPNVLLRYDNVTARQSATIKLSDARNGWKKQQMILAWDARDFAIFIYFIYVCTVPQDASDCALCSLYSQVMPNY